MNNEFEIDFELYKIFFVTAESKNITSAAKKLFLTQPSVTKRIQTLEEQLGCKLFVRSKRGVLLTSEGQILMSRVGPACRMILAAERELRSLRSLESGSVSIVSTEMSFKSYVLPATERFTRKHPGIKIKFANALNESMVKMLRTGQVDIAIMHEPFQTAEDMTVEVIDQMDEYMVCGSRFAELTERENSPAELIKYPFVSMPQGSSTMEYLRRYFDRFGLSFDPDIELTTVELMVQAIESGLGIGILPERIAMPKIKDGAIFRVRVSEALPMREACVITSSQLPLSIAAKAFVQELLGREKI